MIFGEEVIPLHPPGTGERHQHAFPWPLALTALHDHLIHSA